MSDVKIVVESSGAINAIYFGLAASGYTFARDRKEQDVLRMIERVEAQRLPKDLERFFQGARQDGCEPYPYWPRAALMETRTLFADDGLGYIDTVMRAPNLLDEERDERFWRWIGQFPEVLDHVLALDAFQLFDEEMRDWVERERALNQDKIDLTARALSSLLCDLSALPGMIRILLCPLKCAYAADYQQRDGIFNVIVGELATGPVMHEFLHPIVHPHIEKLRGRILSRLVGGRPGVGDENALLNQFEGHIARTLTELLQSGRRHIDIHAVIERELKG